MDEASNNGAIQPRASRQEAKADVTTRVAREILDAEASRRDAKTEKLRQARLLRDAQTKDDGKPEQPGKARR